MELLNLYIRKYVSVLFVVQTYMAWRKEERRLEGCA